MRVKKARLAPCLEERSGPLQSLLGAVVDDQVILDAEHARHLTDAHAGDLLIHGAIDRAVEADVSAVDDDTDRAGGIDCVAAPHGITVKKARGMSAQVIVENRN